MPLLKAVPLWLLAPPRGESQTNKETDKQMDSKDSKIVFLSNKIVS